MDPATHGKARRLNVAIVAPSMGILGGQAVQAERLVRAWHGDPDVHAWLVPINPVPPTWLRGALGIKYLRTLATQVTYLPLLLRELRRADVVHVFSASYFSFLLAPLPAVSVARLFRRPVVMNYRSGEAPDHLRRSAIARRTLRAVERNAVPSRFLKEVFAEHGIESEIIPNIVDVERFAFRVRDPLRPNVLSTRNFEPLYNVACSLRAFRLVQNRYPDATLTLVGAGSQDESLRQLAAALELRHVRFAGRVPPEDIWGYYAEADIYLQTPNIDNMPASVLEAFASGCPVVSTNAGGVPAILTDGVHGLLVQCDDHQAAADRMLTLLSDGPLVARLTAAARASCEQYRWTAVRARWLDLYTRMAASVPFRAARRTRCHPAVTILQRLRQAGAAELRCRLATELRKSGGRMRAAVSRERWRRRTLGAGLRRRVEDSLISRARQALRDNDWGLAHRSLATHFATRGSRFPLDPATLPELAGTIVDRFPLARPDAVARAENMLQGRYDVLGYKDVQYGTPPAWLRDPVHGRQPPFAFWSVVPYLDPQYGDHKIIWEINRHQHWLALGRAYHLTGDRRYYDAFVAQLEDWMAANPPLQGANWASMLELGFRTLSWIWALHLFAPAALSDAAEAPPWTVDLLLGINRQLSHIEHNLSRYFSPNTHLSGEALAIYVAGSCLPELARSGRRAALGRRILLEEIGRQVTDDGGHAELSAHYHRYSTDFYLLATLVARLTSDPAAPAFEDAARRQAGFLRAITDEAGRLPLIGDDDGGQLFPVCGPGASDCRDTLCSAAAILGAPALAVGSTPEAAFWFCGSPFEDTPRVAAGSQAFPASGYYVSRSTGGDHLILDAGRLGYLNAGHAHADALAIVLTTGGNPFLVDAGTCTYTMDPAERDRFRSTAMHNTVVMDGRSQSEPRGPFHWASQADARCLVWQSDPRFDYVEGVHDGYTPAMHARAVLAVHDVGWIVIDHLLGPPGTHLSADLFWHIHPDWRVLPGAGGLAFGHPDGSVRSVACTGNLEVLSPEAAEGLDAYSPVYGRRERGLCLRARATVAVPYAVATFIPAAWTEAPAAVEGLAVTRPPTSGWHAAAFRLSWAGRQALVLAATESAPGVRGGGSPGALWGGDLACTDARAAFVQLQGGVPLIVLGTRATVSAGVRRA